ncbi:glycosyltransferase family protein [Paraglaciecola arctica]|uniref:Glycosyltransferase subfamily 4-like N-terminal domain-containing protein n=1 Tax=Paraglaciecola arctica BSs20135 TaxID=493475 RepID=K6XD38_9ALTE|nr:hypothetical protein [Paraglaciecola arctica]GAC18549.1 hypothetical protein GARC_1577 [Paraglaciecola arctica BSs20135]
MNQKHKILYIAYHYPPILGSSGVHRTLAFTRFLAEKGWDVTVLTASLKAYERWSEEQLQFIPDNVEVIRAFARNTAKDLSWRGKYLAWMALPDNWQSWIVGGVISGLWSILKNKQNVLVSTYPIASAHFIAYILHKLTGIPWIADFRDPMAQADYPTEPVKKRWFEWIEKKIIKHCKYALITAPGAKIFYEYKYPQCSEDFWQIIPNGFDETLFADLHSSQDAVDNQPKVILHSGVIYPSERDPTDFFNALAELQNEGSISSKDIVIRLRATGHDDLFRKQLAVLKIDQLVQLEPTVPYRQALQEMFDVDGLLLLQAANCNYQIPAKAYEYIRVQKPVLALTPSEGDTGQLLLQAGNTVIAPLDNKERIKVALMEYIHQLSNTHPKVIDSTKIQKYSRQFQAYRFTQLLDNIKE